MRSHKQSLKHISVHPKTCPDMLAKPRRSKTVSNAAHTFLGSGYIPAAKRKTSSGIFDKRTYNQIRTILGRFLLFNKYTVTIVYNTQRIRTDFFNC